MKYFYLHLLVYSKGYEGAARWGGTQGEGQGPEDGSFCLHGVGMCPRPATWTQSSTLQFPGLCVWVGAGESFGRLHHLSMTHCYHSL